MNQLFYNTAGGIEYQIRLEKQTTILEVIVRGKRIIKQNRNWFYFNFSVESSSFIFNNFKREKLKFTFKVEKDQFVICLVLPECLSVNWICCISPSDTNRWLALMPSLLFRYFSLFLPHLRTLAQEKRSENYLRFGTGGPSLCLCPLSSRNIIFCPTLTMAARAKKSEAICSRHHWHQCALSGFWAHLRILNLIAWLC